MFEKLAQIVQQLQNSQNPFDPAQFGDPIAVQTGWRPIKGGGSNIRTYKLVKVNPYRMEFKSTIGAIIFSLIFALPGTGLLILLIPNVDCSSIDMGIVIGLLLGLVFASLGWYMFFRQMRPFVFDKQEGFLWKGRKPQAEMRAYETTDKYVWLESVHALQIIAEYISGKNGGYYSYELNLVLKNGNRINIVDHGCRKKLAEDAEVLGEFLGVPVWDGTIGRPPVNTFSATGNQ
jgi:hypothetical protein